MARFEHQLAVASYRPAQAARIAQVLRFKGVSSQATLEHAERWGADWRLAWSECDRFELLLPLALLMGAPVTNAVSVARAWFRAALDALEGVGALKWSAEDRALALDLVGAASAPDVDVEHLIDLRIRAIERARRPGAHQELLAAAVEIAALGIMRVRQPLSAEASSWWAAEHLRGALAAAGDDPGQGDLFAARVDVEAFARRACEIARERIEVA